MGEQSQLHRYIPKETKTHVCEAWRPGARVSRDWQQLRGRQVQDIISANRILTSVELYTTVMF